MLGVNKVKGRFVETLLCCTLLQIQLVLVLTLIACAFAALQKSTVDAAQNYLLLLSTRRMQTSVSYPTGTLHPVFRGLQRSEI